MASVHLTRIDMEVFVFRIGINISEMIIAQLILIKSQSLSQLQGKRGIHLTFFVDINLHLACADLFWCDTKVLPSLLEVLI